MYIKIGYRFLSNIPKWSLLYCYIGANEQDGRLSVIIFEIEFLRFCYIHDSFAHLKVTSPGPRPENDLRTAI